MSAATVATTFRAAADGLLTPARRRAARHGLIVSGVLVSLMLGWNSFQGPAIDAHAYWANKPPVEYAAAPGTDGAFLYSPAFAHVLAPLTALQWEAFLALWLTAMLLTLLWLVGPLLLLPAVVLTSNEVYYANIHFFMAAAIVLGFRHSWTWALVLLTKITPGVGLLWFAVRREWRSLAIALAATAAIVAVSFALDPQGWFGWKNLLEQSIGGAGHATAVPGPLWLRVLVAAGVVIWGARTDRAWSVPVAAFVALPHGTIGSAILIGVIPLIRRRPDRAAVSAAQ